MRPRTHPMAFSNAPRLLLVGLAVLALGIAACGEGESIVEPGPGSDESSTTTTTEVTQEDESDDSDEVVTEDTDETPQTTSTIATSGDDGATNANGTDGAVSPGTTFVVNEDSENAAVYSELAVSGLVLTLDEQTCADTNAESSIGDGTDSVDAVIGAVQDCASPKAIDDFASNLILAGGLPLPATEAACVSSKLQSTDEYRPFWIALLEEESFDFLLADGEVQNRYLDLYADCVSVGRAVAQQANVDLSTPTRGCIDALYTDREFVRLTIEADLSGNKDDLSRIDSQLAGCLTTEERNALAAN